MKSECEYFYTSISLFVFLCIENILFYYYYHNSRKKCIHYFQNLIKEERNTLKHQPSNLISTV